MSQVCRETEIQAKRKKSPRVRGLGPPKRLPTKHLLLVMNSKVGRFQSVMNFTDLKYTMFSKKNKPELSFPEDYELNDRQVEAGQLRNRT